KTSAPIYVMTPVVCVAGGVQPDRLAHLRGGTADDGFPDRMLLSLPVAPPLKWTDQEDDPAVVQRIEHIFVILRERWAQDPVTVRFAPRAGTAFRRFHDDNADALARATGLAAGWTAKAPRHLARIALVLHCLTNPDEPGRDLSEATLDAAVKIVEYHRA